MVARQALGGYPRHNWLPAVVPVQARRFRVDDTALAETLADGGAEIVVDGSPDVEIAPASRLRGDAPCALVNIEHVLSEGGNRTTRIAQRSLASVLVRARARRTRADLRARGYPGTELILWDWEQVVHLADVAPPRRLRLADRFPLGAVLVGKQEDTGPTTLEAALQSAGEVLGSSMRPSLPLVRQGGLVTIMDHGVVRVAIGPARRELELLQRALTQLKLTSPPTVVSGRVPWPLGRGRVGLADWSLERRLLGAPPGLHLGKRLLSQSVDFLVALHGVGGDFVPGPSLRERAEVIAVACGSKGADVVRELGRHLDGELADVERGFAHGDFWVENLLAHRGNLVGVVDWHAAGPGRLPLGDLLHLRLSLIFGRTRQFLGAAFVEHLLPSVRAGGDSVVRSYCKRIGLRASGERLEALALAYWLTRTASELEMYADRRHRPVWMRENVELVVRHLSGQDAGGSGGPQAAWSQAVP